MSNSRLQIELDLTLVKQYILLPIILEVLERDIQTLNLAPLKMTAIYVKDIQQVQKMVHDDLVRIRKQMRSHDLKVYEERRTTLNIEAKYICRGYHHSFAMLWGLVKAETEIYLASYFNIDLDEIC